MKTAPTVLTKTLEIPLNEIFLAAEAPKGVNLVVRDSGSGSPLTDAELEASIRTSGILIPLIFKIHEGKRYAIAGNRRLTIMRRIFADHAATTVPAQDVAGFGSVHWRQVALDTNLSLPAHAVERFEQIVTLSKELKLSPEDAQSRFGLTARQYNQVMALGKMSPLIREQWRVGNIDAKTAQTFTLEPDPKEQDRIFMKVQKENSHFRGGRVQAYDIRDKIVPSTQREAGKLVTFVGVETCKKAKIIKQEDLFSTDHLVTDMKALKKLADEKMWAKRKELTDAGWNWTLTKAEYGNLEYQYGQTEPKTKVKPTDSEAVELERLKKIADDEDHPDADDASEQLEILQSAIAQRGYTDDQKKRSGCLLEIKHDGTLSISYGRLKPNERKPSSSTTSAPSASKPKAKPGAPPALTNALAERLSIQLENGIRAAMKKSPRASVAALIAAIASHGDVVDIAAGGRAQTYEDRQKKKGSFASIFEGALKSTPEAQGAMLMSIASEALSIKTFNSEKDPLKDVDLQALIAALNPGAIKNGIADAFDAKDYFGSIAQPAIVDAVRCACGEGAAAEVAKMKKGAAAEFAAKHVPGTGWLPQRLRTVHYSGPTESAKAKPTKKAATKKAKPVKKAARKK